MSEKIKLDKKEGEILKESVFALKNRFKQSTCRSCGEPITFQQDGEGKTIPFDINPLEPHWKTCPYSVFSQRKASPNIVKKLAVLFAVKYGANFEKLAGLSKKETQVVHAILEKAFKESSESEDSASEDSAKVNDEEGLSFVPGTHEDPIGDPDEERAPSEELIKNLESVELDQATKDKIRLESDKKFAESVEKVLDMLPKPEESNGSDI